MAVSGRSVIRLVPAVLVLLAPTLLFSVPTLAFAGSYGSGSYNSGTYGGNPPSVSTGAATALGQTSVTLGGTITDIGSTSPSVHGFNYGTSITYTASTSVTAGAPFSAGSFSETVSSLTCNTGYHFRAYATSTNGFGYGSDATFTTSACPTTPTPVVVSPGAISFVAGGSGVPNPLPGATSVTPSPATPAPTSSGSGTTLAVAVNLYFGVQDQGVMALQTFLIAQNAGAKARALATHGTTHYFGTLTRAALAEYQAAHGITPASGYFGPKTRAYIAAH